MKMIKAVRGGREAWRVARRALREEWTSESGMEEAREAESEGRIPGRVAELLPVAALVGCDPVKNQESAGFSQRRTTEVYILGCERAP